MATSEFFEIAACANPVEAEQIRGILEEEGVSAFIDGANANTALSYVGTALGGVKVFVRTSDADRAAKIVASLHDESGVSREPWFCGPCREKVDGGFQMCWSCGKTRADVERPFPVSSSDEHDEHDKSGREKDNVTNFPAPDISGYDASNPYASPLSRTDAPIPDEQPLEINEEAEAMLLRAWRASIIGIVFLPLIAHLYSMYLLIRAATTATTFSPVGQKRFYRAFAINVIAGCMWGIAIHLAYG